MAARQTKPLKPQNRKPSPRFKKPKEQNAVDALRQLTETPAKPNHWSKIVREMMKSRNDRGAAVLLGTFVESALEDVITIFLSRNINRRRIFSGTNAPLNTFSDKILMGHALEIYGPETLHNLEIIKLIRNAFAHSRISIRFSTPEVKNVCATLKIPTPRHGLLLPPTKDAPPRKIFQYICFAIVSDFAGLKIRPTAKVSHEAAEHGIFVPTTHEAIVRPKALP